MPARSPFETAGLSPWWPSDVAPPEDLPWYVRGPSDPNEPVSAPASTSALAGALGRGAATGPGAPFGWDPFNPPVPTRSAVEMGLVPFSAAHLGMFAWAPPRFGPVDASPSISNSRAPGLPLAPLSFPENSNTSSGSSGDSLGLGSFDPAPPFGRWGGPVEVAAARPNAGLGTDPFVFQLGPHQLTPPRLTSFAQSPPLANDPPPITSSSLFGGSSDGSRAPASPPRSVLFMQPPPTFDPAARERELSDLDQSAQSLGASDLPLSKSGERFIPPPPPLSHSPDQVLAALRLGAPNLIDYFTKAVPPPSPFPSTPRQDSELGLQSIRCRGSQRRRQSCDPAASLLTGGETTPLVAARMADEAAPGAAASIFRTAGASPIGALDRAALERVNAPLGQSGDAAVADSAASRTAGAAADAPAPKLGTGGPRPIGSYTPSPNLKFGTTPFGIEAHAEVAKILKAIEIAPLN